MTEIKIYFNKNNLAFENLKPLVDLIMPGLLFCNSTFIHKNYSFLRYFVPGIEHILDKDYLSITSSVIFDERIRFYHRSRIEFAQQALIDILIDQVKRNYIKYPIIIKMYNSDQMLESDKSFFSLLIERQKEFDGKIRFFMDKGQHFFKGEDINLIENTQERGTQPGNCGFSFFSTLSKNEKFKRAMGLGLYEDAIKIGENLIKSSEGIERDNLNLKLAVAYVGNDEIEKGEQYYKQIIKDCDFPSIKISALYGLSMLYLRHFPKHKRSMEYGEECLIKARKLIEENKDILGDNYLFHKVFNRNGYSLVLFKKGDYSNAHEYCVNGQKSLAKFYGEDKHLLHRTVLLYNSTMTACALNNFDEALEHFSLLLKLDPYYEDYWSSRGSLYKTIGDYKKALKDFSHAIELNPYAQNFYLQRAETFEVMQEFQKAEKDYLRALCLKPNDTNAILNYSCLLIDLGDYDKALELLQSQAYKESDDLYKIYNNIGLIYLEKELFKESINYFEKTMAIKSNFVPAYINMSTALFECGFLDDALEYLNKGLELETYNPDYLYNRAYLYKTIEDNEKAITDLKEVLQIDPNHTDARLLLSELEMVNTHE